MDEFKHKCACGIEFKQKKNLYAHMRKQHNIEPLQPQIKVENYICDLCGSKFVCQSSIIRHLRRNHSDSNNKLIGVNKKISLMCPYGKCSENFRTYEILRDHLAKKHYFLIEFEELAFNSIKGKACPSRLEVTYTAYAGQTIINVNFWKTHCGHTNEIERLPLNKQMKCSIAEKLEKGYSFKQILEWSRDTQIQDDVSERLQFLNEKDLYNIIREFNIQPVKKKQTPKKYSNFKINRNSAGKSNNKNNILSKVIDGENNKPSTSVSDNIFSTSIDCSNDKISAINDSKNNVSTTNVSKSNKPTTSNSNNDICSIN